jgi:hypothetical protein
VRRQWTARGVWCIEAEMDANLDRPGQYTPLVVRPDGQVGLETR